MSDEMDPQRSNDSLDAATKLYVKEQADQARNQAIGVFGFIALVLSIAATLGVYGSLRSFINGKMQDDQLDFLRERAKSSADTAANHASAAQNAAEAARLQLSLSIKSKLHPFHIEF